VSGLPARGRAARANRSVKRAASSPAYELAARAGYVARGVLYGYMGYAALRFALTGGAHPADQQSSLVAVAGFPLGRVILVAGSLALAAYSLWGFVRAVYDPLHRGRDPVGIASRLGFAWSGVNYGVLSFFAVGLLSFGSGGGSDSLPLLAQRLLSAPAGVPLTQAAGLLGIAGGIGQLVEALRAPFRKDEKREEMPKAERELSDTLGRMGFVARGVVFALMGWFLVLAARFRDPHQAKGFTGTFTYLLAQPLGPWLLGAVALGFIALGVHSVVLARHIRMNVN